MEVMLAPPVTGVCAVAHTACPSAQADRNLVATAAVRYAKVLNAPRSMSVQSEVQLINDFGPVGVAFQLFLQQG